MNEAGRNVLVQAALRGHTQIRGMMHGIKGECVVGLLHLTMHTTREEALNCFTWMKRRYFDLSCIDLLAEYYEMWPRELERLMEMNDKEGLDFLTIARKLEEPTKEGA